MVQNHPNLLIKRNTHVGISKMMQHNIHQKTVGIVVFARPWKSALSARRTSI